MSRGRRLQKAAQTINTLSARGLSGISRFLFITISAKGFKILNITIRQAKVRNPWRISRIRNIPDKFPFQRWHVIEFVFKCFVISS